MEIPDDELIRRYRVLYPQPTQYQVAWAEVLQKTLKEGGEEAEMLRQRLLERMQHGEAYRQPTGGYCTVKGPLRHPVAN